MLIGGGPVNEIVLLLDPANLDVPFSSAAGIKIDFAEELGQNDPCRRRLGLGPRLVGSVGWAMGRNS